MSAQMSYESRMLEQLEMPTRTMVGRALLRTLLKHGGVVKEFGAGQEVVEEIADQFHLNERQRTAAFTLLDNYAVRVSSKLSDLPSDFGWIGDHELIRALAKKRTGIRLPSERQVYPHINSIRWHREFVFHP